MAPRYAAVIGLIFAAGAGLGRYSQPSGPTPPDLRGPVWVVSIDGPHRVNRFLAPFRVIVDGRVEDVPGACKDGEKWRIDLADGRVMLFLAATDKPEGP